MGPDSSSRTDEEWCHSDTRIVCVTATHLNLGCFSFNKISSNSICPYLFIPPQNISQVFYDFPIANMSGSAGLLPISHSCSQSGKAPKPLGLRQAGAWPKKHRAAPQFCLLSPFLNELSSNLLKLSLPCRRDSSFINVAREACMPPDVRSEDVCSVLHRVTQQ